MPSFELLYQGFFIFTVHISTRRERVGCQRITVGDVGTGSNPDLSLQLHRGRDHGLRIGKY
jgi:hypothetical protein